MSFDFKIDDFFAAIRDCYNQRADKRDFRRLTFALMGVATPSDLTQDKQKTPFNIGRAIELTGFQLEEAMPLSAGFAGKSANPRAVLAAVLDWTGGQPFLTQRLCRLIAESSDVIPVGQEVSWVSELVRLQVLDHWEEKDDPMHFRTIRDRLLFDQEISGKLLTLYQQILTNQDGVIIDNGSDQVQLLLSGIVTRKNRRLQVSNQIYKMVFDQSWVTESLSEISSYTFNANTQHKILVLAANPQNIHRLRLDEEAREIQAALERSRYRDLFTIEQRWTVTPRDLQRAILDLNPQLIHFSGGGMGETGLVLESERGRSQLIPGKALAQLFQLTATDTPIECVILSACYDEVQAQSIAEHVPYVIGISQSVSDHAAQEFKIGFYDALGAGRSIPVAYEFGCASLSLTGVEHLMPKLITRRNIPQSTVVKPPLPQATITLETPEGSVSTDSPFYIERPPIESNCYAEIERPGALIRVKGLRHMGQSSLIRRILAHGKQKGYRTVYLNLHSAHTDCLHDIDAFLQWFCTTTSAELGLDTQLEKFWQGVLGSKNKCTNYFQRYLLPTLAEPLALGIIGGDQIFQHPKVGQEFFGLMRAWHEKGKNENLWKKLRIIIAHSTEVYASMNINQSPFNVGLPIELPKFTQSQVIDLIERHGLNWSTVEVQQIIDMVGGHPYLLRKALYEISRGKLTLEKFLEVAPTEEGLYGDHLRQHRFSLESVPELAAAMLQVVTHQAVQLGATQLFQLHSMGLVDLRGNHVEPSCSLYRLYFCDRLP
jgi:hypothetical protein